MKVFGSNFLEELSKDNAPKGKWNWEPINKDIEKIYGTGASTKTQESTYADERDNRTDTDRPDEGFLVA